MNKSKLANISLQAGIHTFNMESCQLSVKTEMEAIYLKSIRETPNKYSNIAKYSYIINLNNTERGNLTKYNQFEDMFIYCLDDMEISEYYIRRCDFRIDSYNDFNELLKLNKCIVLMLSLKYSVKNRYQSKDPLLLEDLTIRIQNTRIECEYYNKMIESNGKDKVKSRLEFRSKAIGRDKDIPTLVVDWIKRLDNLTDYYDKLQSECNKNLKERWELEKGVKVKSISEFLRKYEENIFCRKQLIGFLNLVSVTNASKFADNFKYANKIEYFSEKDLRLYIALIQKSLQDYLN